MAWCHVVLLLQRERTRRAERNRCFIRRWPLAHTALLVTRVRSLWSGLLVEAQHPVKDLQPNTIQVPQHVLPCPYDLALGEPPLERLPARVLALPITCNPPCRALPAAHPHAISHLARHLRAGLAIPLLCTRRPSKCGALLFERNERC